ncbi:MAG: aminotransferase class V-fold PLP-dependent enzyme, partial [Lactobacillus acidophilus]
MNNKIYMDNAGTSPMAPQVVKTMTDMMTNVFGNASATNYYGREAKRVLEDSRHILAESINADDKEIIFTSGGTESDNTAIMQTALARQNEGKHIISTKFEHEAVLRPLARLEKMGFEVTYLNVDK